MKSQTFSLIILARIVLALAFLALITFCPAGLRGQQPDVLKSGPLTPEQQLKKFRLPPGFKIELFAAGPEIEKPTNMAFDGQGRLWVSSTHEYPVAAAAGTGQDRIQVLSDTDGDGRSDLMTTFAAGLNIPMGVYPFRDGAIGYSIPGIYFFDDKKTDPNAGDPDGRSEEASRTHLETNWNMLYGPMGDPLDTHGLQNSFRRGYDGWVYVCHGYRNQSTIEGADGSKIELHSGNSYRIKPDGSRVEVFTHGQVNPFGSLFLENGDLLSVDCHSFPVSVLLREGIYRSFGKPDDGMGFAPNVITHKHGPSAICGVASARGTNFPAEYQDSLFVGNVVSSRLKRETITYNGSTASLRPEPDFLICDDPWFRPVDLQVGPDGALYVADFYNQIIGHYEFPLDDPRRDRTRGRIWRISYIGDSPTGVAAPPLAECKLSTADLPTLIEALNSPLPGTRMLATDQISDRIGSPAIGPVRQSLTDSENPFVQIHALWILYRLNKITKTDIETAVMSSTPMVRNHAMRVLSELSKWDDQHHQWAVAGLKDSDPFVQRSAADALGQHPDSGNISLLIETYENTPESDTLLRHTIRMALRNHLKIEGAIAGLNIETLKPAALKLLAGVALAVTSRESAACVLEAIRRAPSDRELLVRQLKHVAGEGDEAALVGLIEVIRQKVPDDIDLQIEFLDLVSQQIPRASTANRTAVMEWARRLLEQLQNAAAPESSRWVCVAESNPWGLEDRICADGKKNVSFLSSLPGGEPETSVLASRPFSIPDQLTFFLCGHRGLPGDLPGTGNLVRLRLIEKNKIVRTVYPPRNDVAQEIVWDLKEFTGQHGVLEIVDGNSLETYAWLAISRFEPPVIAVPKLSPQLSVSRQVAQARIAQTMGLIDQIGRLKSVVSSQRESWQSQIACAEALAVLEPGSLSRALVSVLPEQAIEFELRRKIMSTMAGTDSERRDIVLDVMRVAPNLIQEMLAARLATDRDGARTLIGMIQKGDASARLLQRKDIRASLIATRLSGAENEIAKLTRGLPPVEQRTLDLINQLNQKIADSPTATATQRVTSGRAVFEKNCAICHQVGGVGMVVGPHLDGIGMRTTARILEDILDPNRNVDGAFASSIVLLDDGRVISGIFRRLDGENSVFVNSEGKEVLVPTDTIEEQRKSQLSVMPGNFADALNDQDSVSLISYLETLREAAPTPVTWQYEAVDSSFRSEGTAIADINRDGKLDILAGEFWYEAPQWTKHEITTPGDYGDGAQGYSHCFECFSADVNQDGWPDQIVIGMPAEPCYWFENPKGESEQGESGHWKKHDLWESACNETPLFVDLFGNKTPVLVMAWHPGGKEENGQMIWLEPGNNPDDGWDVHPISLPGTSTRPVPGTKRFSHGLGTGDMNDDGRTDVICTGGWWEQPASVGDHAWVFHRADLGPACADMLVVDLNGDDRKDVISSSAHQYGIWRHEQMSNDEHPAVEFNRDDMFPGLVSQTHAMQMVDIDGDGTPDFVTGKRFWAHGPQGDPGSEEPARLFWFQGTKADDGSITFTERLIHDNSGIGTQFVVGDVNGDGLPDVVTSNKKGVHLFLQGRRAIAEGN